MGQCRPRRTLGDGRWHTALPKLTRMNPGVRGERYPHLVMSELVIHVAKAGTQHQHRRRERQLKQERLHNAPSAELTGRVWQSRRESGSSSSNAKRPPGFGFSNARSTIRAGSLAVDRCNPGLTKQAVAAKSEQVTEEQAMTKRTKSEELETLTELSSDDSDASIFGLCDNICSSDEEWSDGEESLISSDNEEVAARAERDSVAMWRLKEHLLCDRDFAFVCTSFEEACLDSGPGRAVSMAWSRCRQRAELSLNTDAAHALSITATSAMIMQFFLIEMIIFM